LSEVHKQINLIKSLEGDVMRFEDLDVWKRSARLSADIYKNLSGLKDYGFKDLLRLLIIIKLSDYRRLAWSDPGVLREEETSYNTILP
jgi:hypothetical protein